MLNYDEIVTRTNDHRAFLLTNAEQQRLAQTLTRQPHPFMAWIGRQLTTWGRQLQGETALPTLPAPTVTVSHSVS